MKFSYFGVLLGCLVGTLWLELFLRTRVYRRLMRLILAVLPVVVIFSVWDAYAISQGHWYFSARHLTGLTTISRIPVEEVAFFIIIPLCSILTLEAVRSARGWNAGDELPSQSDQS